jgi:membrane-bound lytic murein transglycosylase D
LLAIAAYDCGEGTIARAIKATNNPGTPVYYWNLALPGETRVYVPRLLALAEIIKYSQHYKINLPNIPYLPYFEEVNIGSQIDLNHAAKLAGISFKELIKLNPGYNRWATAPYKPFKLLIPTEKVERFNLNLSNMPEQDRVSWTKHFVRAGDNLASIATRYHTTVNLIKQLNQLTSNNVKVNQAILIPNTKNAPVIIKKAVEIASVVSPINTMQARRIIHIVQNNENYQNIQKLYGVTTKEIQNWNKLSVTNPLQKGQQLIIWRKVKQPIHYVVRPGDSLSLIAKRHQTKIEAIFNLNPNLSRSKPIRSGQTILVG